LRVAARIAIEIKKEAELDGSSLASSPAVIRAVVCIAALLVHVHGVIGAGNRLGHNVADLA
jgi:hypothetical protein